MKDVMHQNRLPNYYVHGSSMRLHLTLPVPTVLNPRAILDAATQQPHPHFTLDWYKEKTYKNFQKKTVTTPLLIERNGRYLGTFDWRLQRVNDVRGKGDMRKVADALVAYLSELIGLPLTYRIEVRHIEICTFIERSDRMRALEVCRMMDEHFALSRSEKKQDTAYNGVPEVFLSGKLQLRRREAVFRVKLYEAIRKGIVGFKSRQAPKLEVQVEGIADWDEAASFGAGVLVTLLDFIEPTTLEPKDVCIDGAESYFPLLADPLKAQGNQLMEELRGYAAMRMRQQTLRRDPRWPFFEAIYLHGLRSTGDLLRGGFSKLQIKKAASSGLLIAYGKGGTDGNSYRLNFSSLHPWN